MKKNSLRRDSSRGSALLAALIVIVILTFAAAGVLSYSLTTYRNSKRQALLDQAKEYADGEMEYLYYEWKELLLAKTPVANIASAMASSSFSADGPLTGTGVTQTEAAFSSTELAPTVPANAPGWTVSRMIAFNPISGTSDGSAQGIVPGTLQIGHNYYFTAQTSVSYADPVVGTVTYHSGRHFVYSSTSLFQFAVFYQGNLEIAAGGDMVIGGPLSTNASAYMGSQSGYTLTLTDMAYYYQDYNGASDPLTGETDRLEGTGSLSDPIYNPNPLSAAPSDQTSQRALQVNKLTSQSSFIGGVDVASDIVTYAAAYSNLAGVPDPNEVYRAVIAPPPVDGSGALLPEDPVVAASRMYNTAAILITITQTSAGTPVLSGTGKNVTVNVGYASSDPTTLSAYNSDFPNVAGTIVSGRTTIMDPRESLNGAAGVNLTTVDIAQLNAAITGPTGALASDPNLAAKYNGVVYVNDNTDTTTSPGLAGILLKNGTTTPDVNDQNGNPLGFTVVSNNGVYVQGDYNVTQITAGGQQVNNPAAIMGDAITAVSAAWSPAENLPLSQGGEFAIDGPPGQNRQAGPSPPVAANNAVSPAAPAWAGTSDGMTVNAAILTGNTPSTTTTNSGGVQNLVRMMEDWYDPDGGLTLTLNGSLGQLFTSKFFTGPYLGNGNQAGLPNLNADGTNDRVYLQPTTRNFDYDTGFKSRLPAGSPTTTNFARGDFFFW